MCLCGQLKLSVRVYNSMMFLNALLPPATQEMEERRNAVAKLKHFHTKYSAAARSGKSVGSSWVSITKSSAQVAGDDFDEGAGGAPRSSTFFASRRERARRSVVADATIGMVESLHLVKSDTVSSDMSLSRSGEVEEEPERPNRVTAVVQAAAQAAGLKAFRPRRGTDGMVGLILKGRLGKAREAMRGGQDDASSLVSSPHSTKSLNTGRKRTVLVPGQCDLKTVAAVVVTKTIRCVTCCSLLYMHDLGV